ncbi:head-tail joining protein [Falsiruegeria litorea]|uniref:head-tail joining protein n=1 Tax=Falsiruegeria litorea TaxID=1280831 RepID=UPI001BFD2742|nr:hypothetical protein [Falsiruegeria litorea]MBT8169876.1 hypothetical protein [Falsiruegeria litorea]
MIEGPEDWAVFMDPNDFGLPVTYQGAGQAPVNITGIFTAAHYEAARGLGSVSTVTPVLTIAANALPFALTAGDQLTINQAVAEYTAGTVFKVADSQPDGSGMVRLILERT